MNTPPSSIIEKIIREHPGLGTSKVISRNGYIVRSGAKDDHIYLVEDGVVIIYIESEKEEQVIRFGYNGNIVLCLDTFLAGIPTAFYIQAVKKTKYRVIPKHVLEDFMAGRKEHAALWRHALEQLILQQMEREIDLLTGSPAERYRRVRQRSPQIFQYVPHKYIANYLRMTPETLSRIKKS